MNGSEAMRQGKAYLESGEYELAAEAFTEVIRLDPENAIAYNNRGNAYSKFGDRENARADYEKARQPCSACICPDRAYTYLGCLRFQAV